MAEDDGGQFAEILFFMKRTKMASNWTEKCVEQRSRAEMILFEFSVPHHPTQTHPWRERLTLLQKDLKFLQTWRRLDFWRL